MHSMGHSLCPQGHKESRRTLPSDLRELSQLRSENLILFDFLPPALSRVGLVTFSTSFQFALKLITGSR